MWKSLLFILISMPILLVSLCSQPSKTRFTRSFTSGVYFLPKNNPIRPTATVIGPSSEMPKKYITKQLSQDPICLSESEQKQVANEIVKLVQASFGEMRDIEKARKMKKYCKTTMPMYGVQKNGRAQVEKSLYSLLDSYATSTKQSKTALRLETQLYHSCIMSLWELPHREEKYLAIDLAMRYQDSITIESLPLYEEMLRANFMWWDLCDPIAINLVGGVVYQQYEQSEIARQQIKDVLRTQWIDDESSRWIRRSAILAQLKFKDATDEKLLFEFCRKRMHEKDFFIKKAIGWALRQHTRIQPNSVQAFLESERAGLSGLSFREGSKALIKMGRTL